MSRAPQTFRQRDITRMIKAAKAAGEQVRKVEIDKDGKVTVTTSGEPSKEKQQDNQGEWDSAINSIEARK